MAGMREPLGTYESSGEVKIGPFIDETDGITPMTSLTIAQVDVRLSKNNGAFVGKNDWGTAIHDADGVYDVTLNANDISDDGQIIVAAHVSGALPVWHKFRVESGGG